MRPRPAMTQTKTSEWGFLTNHAQVLVCISDDPGVRLRDIGARIGITERAAHRIVADLVDAGYITRTRHGRRNEYTIDPGRTLPDPIASDQSAGELLQMLAARATSGQTGWDRRRPQPAANPTAS
jgi:hypothetical protein